jgi:hypothetical protein
VHLSMENPGIILMVSHCTHSASAAVAVARKNVAVRTNFFIAASFCYLPGSFSTRLAFCVQSRAEMKRCLGDVTRCRPDIIAG